MHQQILTKFAPFCASLGLSLMMVSVDSAWASSFRASQKSLLGDSFWSGSFSGNDINNNNLLEINELNTFNLRLALDSVSFSLENLLDFEYSLGSTSSIFFNVQKRVDINDEFVDYKDYILNVNGFVPFSRLSIINYFNDEPISIADGASNQPVEIESIPEPLTIGGVVLAGVMGSFFKKKIKNC